MPIPTPGASPGPHIQPDSVGFTQESSLNLHALNFPGDGSFSLLPQAGLESLKPEQTVRSLRAYATSAPLSPRAGMQTSAGRRLPGT